MAFLAAFLRLDRRVIFLLVAIAMVVPLAHPFAFPGLSVTGSVKSVYDQIESMPPGSNLLLSFDFDPASKPELEPQARAVLRHALRKKLDVVVLTLWLTGRPLAQDILQECAEEAKAEEGRDYAFLGWQPGNQVVVIGMGQDIAKIFPKDARDKATADLPIMRDIKILRDFQYVISFGAGSPGIETWITFGTDEHKVPMAGGTTSINAAGMFPYLQSGQMKGLLNGMKGAAEYELLIDRKGTGTGGMDSMALGAFLIIALVLAANLAALLTKGRAA